MIDKARLNEFEREDWMFNFLLDNFCRSEPFRRDFAEKNGLSTTDPLRLARFLFKQKFTPHRKRPAKAKPQASLKARYEALRRANGSCQLCGASARDGVELQVDHIKPLSSHPELANDPNNLQVLCKPCNLGKSNSDEIDWR